MARITGRVTNKRPMLAVSTDEVVAVLGQLSKAALIDLVADACAIANGSGDTAPTVAQVLDFIAPVVEARGDRMPRQDGRTPLERAVDRTFRGIGKDFQEVAR